MKFNLTVIDMPHPHTDIDRALKEYPEFVNEIRNIFGDIHTILRDNQGQGWTGRVFFSEKLLRDFEYPTPAGPIELVKVPRSFDDGAGTAEFSANVEESRVFFSM